MARLEAVEKMLYYPTDLETIRLLVEKHIRIYGHSGYPLYILDPCVGEGLAVDTFRDALMGRVRQAASDKRTEIENYKSSGGNYSWRVNAYGDDYYLRSMQGDLASIESWLDNMTVHGVELDIQRAMAARELLGEKNVLESAFEYVQVQGMGKFNVLWMNPPYDQVNGRRAELTWIDMAAPMITEGGLIVLIVPDMFVGTGRRVKEMQLCLRHNGISDAMVLRFPDHSYPQFKQVAIIARKKQSGGYGYYSDVNLGIRGIIGQAQSGFDWAPCKVDILPTLMKVEARTDLESVFSANIDKLKVLVGSPHSNGETIRPLIPMRPEHAAMMAAAGKFNGVIIEDKVIKGGTVKRVIHTEEARGKGAVISDKEVFAATISELFLDTGEIVTVNNLDNEEQFNETIRANAHELIEIANRMFPAQFLPEDPHVSGTIPAGGCSPLCRSNRQGTSAQEDQGSSQWFVGRAKVPRGCNSTSLVTGQQSRHHVWGDGNRQNCRLYGGNSHQGEPAQVS